MTHDNLPTRRDEAGTAPQVWPEESIPDYGPMDAEEESGFDVGRLFAAVLRFKWVVVGATLLGALGGGIAWSQVQFDYSARGSLWIENSGLGQVGNARGISAGQLLTASSWIDLMRSFAVLNTVVVDRRLYLIVPDSTAEPAFASFGLEDSFLPGDYELLYASTSQEVTLLREGAEIETQPSGQRIGVEVGFRWTPSVEFLTPDVPIGFSVEVPRVVATELNRNLGARLDETATFISVTLRGDHPENVSLTLNAIMDKHVELAAEMKNAALNERTTVLEGQLTSAEAEVRAAEQALEFFKVNTIALPSDAAIPIQGGISLTQGPAFQIYQALKLEIEDLRSNRRAMERVLATHPDSTLRVEALEAIPAVGTSSQLEAALGELTTARAMLRALRQRYTDEYGEVQELVGVVRQLETEAIPALLRSLVQRIQNDENRLQDRIDDATLELGDIPPRTIEESRLDRAVALSNQLYGELRGRYQEAVLASASSVPDVRVLDRATPPTTPDVDARMRAALMFLVSGLGAGVALAILADRLDSRVQYTSDITNSLGLDILGTVPVMGDGKPGSERQAVEAFRDLRVNLEFAYGVGKPLALTLTSPDQSEGKSTVIANLAIAFASAGRRTLVIDGDTRKGDLHKMLGVPRKPGLTDYLKGDADVSETVQETEFSGLHVMPSGSRSTASPEMLASGRLGDLRGELWNRYDVILMDSPPLGAGADALILGTLTGQHALVLRTGHTNVSYAKAKLADLDRLPVRTLGVVVNGFVPGRSQGYYEYAEYIDGYAAVDEPVATLGRVEG